MKFPAALLLMALLSAGQPAASGANSYTSANPASAKTSGALLFASRQAVTECFSRVFASPSRGFRVCESSAKRLLAPGVRLTLLEKYDAEVVAKVKVLDGKDRGQVGFIHEMWISPSPWASR
jgi:hypothetical protein